MNKVLVRYPLVLFTGIGAIIGSLTALFFNPQMRWALLFSSSLTGFVIAVIFQQIRQNTARTTKSTRVVSAITPELKPLPEPITSLFLYNTLHNIAALILFDTIRASESIENLANFVRTVSELKKNNQTFLGEEFKALDLYLSIEKARLGDRLIVTKQFSQNCFEIPFPSLALFPFIDGCIRYGAELHVNPVTVLIACREENSTIILEIADRVEEYEGETWDVENRDAIYDQAKKRLVDFYGSSVKITREKIEPQGEQITVIIPLGNAMISRRANQEPLQQHMLN